MCNKILSITYKRMFINFYTFTLLFSINLLEITRELARIKSHILVDMTVRVEYLLS